jgi:Protein of unknown function (DUF1800)
MNRRTFLKSIGVGSAGALTVGTGMMRALAAPELPPALRFPAMAEERSQAFHALNRLAYGPRPGQLAAVEQQGVQAWIEAQLNPESIDDSAMEALLGEFITLDLSYEEMLAVGMRPPQAAAELVKATILRQAFSERQLLEVMTNFWSEHFSVFQLKKNIEYLKTVEDRDVIRKFALGNFRDLLGASAHSPAMLDYLDNAGSRREHPNENYARELMELHTITIGNYDENDVKELARTLTGWSIKRTDGLFIFRPNFHDDGAKRVIGIDIPAGVGKQGGEMILDALAIHPGTAKHMASKLCRRFIGDVVPDSVVEPVKQAFLSSNGDIKTTLRTLFALPEFWAAGPKYKRPLEFVISAMRGTDLSIEDASTQSFAIVLTKMGHRPFGWLTPDGYNDDGRFWIGNMLDRWNCLGLGPWQDARRQKRCDRCCRQIWGEHQRCDGLFKLPCANPFGARPHHPRSANGGQLFGHDGQQQRHPPKSGDG